MSTGVELAPEPDVEWPSDRKRRHRRLFLVALVVVLLATGGIGWLVYTNTYQPLQGGNYSIHVSNVLSELDDGLGRQTIVLTGPAGSTATLMYSILNNGPFDITLLPSDFSLGPPGYVRYRWAPPTGDGNDYYPGLHPGVRSLPARVPAHGWVALYVSVTRPQCYEDASGGTYWLLESLPLRWEALGVHHRTQMSLGRGSPALSSEPVALCYRTNRMRELLRTEGVPPKWLPRAIPSSSPRR